MVGIQKTDGFVARKWFLMRKTERRGLVLTEIENSFLF